MGTAECHHESSCCVCRGFAPTLGAVYSAPGIADAVTFKLSPGIRGPEHTHAGYSCVDEQNCDKEVYFLCAQSVGASVEFLVCQDASNAAAKEAAQKCAASNKNQLDWGKITTCFNGKQGAALKKQAALYFDKAFPQPIGVPHIEVNGKAWGVSSQRTEAGLIKALCDTGIQAAACKNSNSSEALSYL